MQTCEAPAGRPLDAAVAVALGWQWFAHPNAPIRWLRPVDVFRYGAIEQLDVIEYLPGLPRYSAPQDDRDRAELLGVLLWLMRHPRVTILAEAGYTTLDGPHVWKTMELDTTDLAAFALSVSRAAVLVSGAEEIEER